MTITDVSLRRALTISALALASITLAGCSLLPGGGGNDPAPTASASEEGDDVFSIEVGDCLNDADADAVVSRVPIVECTEPHDSEAFDTGNVPDGEFPGEDAITEAAEQLCGPSFISFVGLDYSESLYDYSFYFPTEESWASGDRAVLCVAFADDGAKITGSLKDINS